MTRRRTAKNGSLIEQRSHKKLFRQNPRCVIGLLLLILLITCSVAINTGRFPTSPRQICEALFGQGDPRLRMLLLEFRLPRMILAALVGFGMGMSGSMMQTLLHNELASPGTLGVSAGSGLFVSLYVALFKTHTSTGILLCFAALLGGLFSAGIIFIISMVGHRDFQHSRLIMTGIALSSAYGAVGIILMMLIDPNRMEFLQRWNSGELWGTNWVYIGHFSVWLLIAFWAVYSHNRTLDVISLSYEMAVNLGVELKRTFIYLSVCAVAMASSAVAFGGNFFFLGLIGPHIARYLVGTEAKWNLPASAMVSAIIVLVADMIVNQFSFAANIPTGIVISVLSVPYFLYLMIRR